MFTFSFSVSISATTTESDKPIEFEQLHFMHVLTLKNDDRETFFNKLLHVV